MRTFYVEVTDTFGDDANYCWVHRFKVSAKSPLGAIRKVGKGEWLRFRKAWDSGDAVRYDAVGSAICAFVSDWDDSLDYKVTVL